jgi:hypothetical protein
MLVTPTVAVAIASARGLTPLTVSVVGEMALSLTTTTRWMTGTTDDCGGGTDSSTRPYGEELF